MESHNYLLLTLHVRVFNAENFQEIIFGINYIDENKDKERKQPLTNQESNNKTFRHGLSNKFPKRSRRLGFCLQLGQGHFIRFQVVI